MLDLGKKQLEARVRDCLRLSEKYASARFTCFLTEEEQRDLEEIGLFGYNTALFGGYSDARRRMLGVFPEWEEIDFSRYPIEIVSLEKKYEKELTHRDYLGTVLSLGIERNKIGDIVVHQNGAYIFAGNSVADVITSQVEKVANCGVKAKIAELSSIRIPQQEYDDIHCIAASLRLDAIVGGITKLSRAKAADLIRAKKTSVNHKVIEDISKSIVPGDIISLRGYGRFIVVSEEGKTGSGRIHVHVKKFR